MKNTSACVSVTAFAQAVKGEIGVIQDSKFWKQIVEGE
jgi:hypothetical protein